MAQLELERKNSSNYELMSQTTPVAPRKQLRAKRKLATELEKLKKSDFLKDFDASKARIRRLSLKKK